MSISQDEVINYLSNLSVIDLVNLTKALEDKWGVKAAPVAVAAGTAGPRSAAPAAPPEGETAVTRGVKSRGGEKKAGIKGGRRGTRPGPTEAQRPVDGGPH